MAQAQKSNWYPARKLEIEDSENPMHWHWERPNNCGEEEARLLHDTVLDIKLKIPVDIAQPHHIKAYLEYDLTDTATNVDKAYAYFGLPPPPEVSQTVTLKHKREVLLGEVYINPVDRHVPLELVARLWGLDKAKSKSGLIVRAIKITREYK